MNQPATPFDTIESAHEFLTLLSLTIAEAKREVTDDVKRERSGNARRRLDALRMAVYNLERLEFHLNKSARLLNDLRSLRRLLFQERGAPTTVVAFHQPGNGKTSAAAD